MGKIFASLDSKIQNWISRQHMFFVATAPESGHINLSPKGNDTLRVLDEHTIAYIDTGGSGIETVAHLRENGRIVIMMCAFEGPPKIYRFHGHGTVITPNESGFAKLSSLFNNTELGIRTIIKVDITRISDSCGFGVPLLEFNEERRAASEYLKTHGVQRVSNYIKKNNLHSIDGLAGITEEEAEAFTGPNKSS